MAVPEDDCREGMSDAALEGAVAAYGVWVVVVGGGVGGCGDWSCVGGGGRQGKEGRGGAVGELGQLSEAGGEYVVGVLLRRWGVAAAMRLMSPKVTASNSCRSRWSRSCDADSGRRGCNGGTMGNSVGGGGGGGLQGEEDRCNRVDG